MANFSHFMRKILVGFLFQFKLKLTQGNDEKNCLVKNSRVRTRPLAYLYCLEVDLLNALKIVRFYSTAVVARAVYVSVALSIFQLHYIVENLPHKGNFVSVYIEFAQFFVVVQISHPFTHNKLASDRADEQSVSRLRAVCFYG